MKSKIILLVLFCLVAVSGFSQATEPLVQNPEVLPKFQGGTLELYKFINDRMNYSAEDKERHASGEFIMTFTVSSSGKISDIEIKKGIGTTIDNELKKIIQSMPDWVPGRADRKNIASRFSLTMMVNADMQSITPIFW